ncbi:MAG: hypothetical protein J1F10_03625 [Muribaculaceae bacterium]|nr:hypothetical protein [Muribaculaceae bacterium]
MKKFLFLAVAAVAFVACNNKPAENQAEAPAEVVEVVEEVCEGSDSVPCCEATEAETPAEVTE